MPYTVAEARRLRNITKADMAKMLNMSLTAYDRRESNPSWFRIFEAYAFASAVEMNYDDLLFYAQKDHKVGR